MYPITRPLTYPITKQITGNMDNLSNWTPSQITTSMWFDASDSTTITLNGSNVSQWRDKSGAGRNMSQATAASQPAYVESSINGKAVVSLDGSNDFMFGATGLAGGAFSVFAVLQYKNATTTQQGILCNDLSTTAPSTYWQANAGTFRGYNGNYVSGGAYTANQIDSIGTTQTPSAYTIYRSGNVVGTGGAAVASTNNGFQIGRLGNGSLFAYAQVDFGEIITVNAVNTTARQLIEGYLAWKWGGV